MPTGTLTSTPPPPTVPITPTATPLQAEVDFTVEIPDFHKDGDGIFIDILDEVTGLALNPTRYQMKAADSKHYAITLPFTLGSVIRYRYYRGGSGSSAIEYTPLGRPVRYRLFYVTGKSAVSDLVSAWNDAPFNGPYGRITGQVVTAGGAGAPNLLVIAGGVQTITGASGGFELQGVAEGVHNMVAYAMDGAYTPFQQGAAVRSGQNTPVTLTMQQRAPVNVTFNVTVPGEYVGVPVRLAGSLSTLGNTFADLAGGISVIASRTPLLTPVGERQYSLTVAIPAGTHVSYKYTLGDGFWNAEQTSEGGFRMRELIIPEKDVTVSDSVETWRSNKSEPVTFEVVVPANTPTSDTVSIAFNPAFGWTQAIPMWKIESNRWMYVLASPLNMVEKLSYRYCRNDQCGSADDSGTIGPDAAGYPFNIGRLPQTFEDDITSWAWWQPSNAPTTVLAADARSRPDGFITGVEFQPNYHPTWQPYILGVMSNLAQTGSNTVVLTPGWTYTQNNPPVLQPLPGRNPLLPELTESILQARGIGLRPVLYPVASFERPVADWWKSGARDFSWWQTWFTEYRGFILNYADVAQQTGASGLVLGGDWLAPALPGGTLVDGSPSNVPGDAAVRWQQIIADVRARYTGRIFWALPYHGESINPPAFIADVDALYVEFFGKLSDTPTPTEKDLETGLVAMFERDLLPIHDTTGKPLILAAAFPSAQGAASGCLPDPDNGCYLLSQLDRPNPDLPGLSVDLQAQVDIYNALLYTVNQKDWIDGFVARGFYPPAGLEDKSDSLNGKPAFHVLWYWYPLMIGR